jgi:phosphate acetyltransferase
MESLDGELEGGDPALLAREAMGVVVSAMSLENVLVHLIEGSVVIVPGDRSEVLLGVLMAHQSGTFPRLTGIILNGGFASSPPIMRLIEGLGSDLPIVRSALNTFDTVLRIMRTRGKLAAESQRKRDRALALFDRHIDGRKLLDLLEVVRDDIVTPLMFEYQLLERAQADPRHIVLPEGEDNRILRAASTLLQRGAARLTILGGEADVSERAARLDLDLVGAEIVDPSSSDLRELFAETYARLRSHKGMTIETARDVVTDVSYFGTLMVHLGLADGMVSGATHTTAHTIRPAFEIIKTVPDVSSVSSVFLMCLEDRVLVYGDCAVIPNPTAEQLADIAISSAQTATRFGIEPRVAMLSYSTGESGTGDDVEKVRTATRLVRERRPDLPIEGPIQYDAASDATVALAKMPDSSVAGHATVFIFPDLNTGNNTYKAVQRSAGAVAVGPVLQGLRKPINDLSRGALVKDIVNTVAITVIQAQGEASNP